MTSTSARMLDIAAQQFAEKGYSGASMRSIANAVGTTQATIYHHFPNKRALYLIGGVGWVDFAGEEELAWNFGFGYKLLATDWLSIRLDARDHIFENDVLGESDTNHNLEFTGGLSIFF